MASSWTDFWKWSIYFLCFHFFITGKSQSMVIWVKRSCPGLKDTRIEMSQFLKPSLFLFNLEVALKITVLFEATPWDLGWGWGWGGWKIARYQHYIHDIYLYISIPGWIGDPIKALIGCLRVMIWVRKNRIRFNSRKQSDCGRRKHSSSRDNKSLLLDHISSWSDGL